MFTFYFSKSVFILQIGTKYKTLHVYYTLLAIMAHYGWYMFQNYRVHLEIKQLKCLNIKLLETVSDENTHNNL